MKQIRAVGFDLFNTLITVEPQALDEAVSRLTAQLTQSGLTVEHEAFTRDHRRAALQFVEATRRDGRETHNRFWISAALVQQGFDVAPDDPRIAGAVEAYFSAFLDLCHLIPGTGEMLGSLGERYRLGLLSNFTHGPAARSILDLLGLSSSFEVLLISGEIGYRKPHPLVFHRLAQELGVPAGETLYIGDDPLADIDGAMKAGLLPVWMTYVRDRNLPLAPGMASGQAEAPDGQALRISGWQELHDLLNGE
jgi:putative hydrolase of the HAD superfamily